MKPLNPFIYQVKRRPTPKLARTHTVHDAAKCVGLPPVLSTKPTDVPLRTPPRVAFTGRRQTPSPDTGQGFVYQHAAVFGAGNPRTIGAAQGERHIVQRTNVSNCRSLVD